MESNNFFNFIQQGLRTAIGATTIVVETLQDSQKRQQTLSELNEEWHKKSQEWAEKGEITEQEARRFIENFLQKQGKNTRNCSSDSVAKNETNIVSEIQELNQAIVSLRTELEKNNQSQK